MSCSEFDIFDDYTEEELKSASSFLFKHGAALSMELTDMGKDEWLRYHKENAPADALVLLREGFKMSVEELPKFLIIHPGFGDGMERGEAKLQGTRLGALRAVSSFRLGGS